MLIADSRWLNKCQWLCLTGVFASAIILSIALAAMCRHLEAVDATNQDEMDLRVLGFASWNLWRMGKGRGRLAAIALALFLTAIVLACGGSSIQPTQTDGPTATPIVPLPSDAVTVTRTPQVASEAGFSPSPEPSS
ncbi:MAG: hypothetical protein ACRDIB_07245, partial [Ardenticatenaceae bacterium]